jgi:hypothetical protein
MTVSDGCLHLTERLSGPQVDLPIDIFLQSLAEES